MNEEELKKWQEKLEQWLPKSEMDYSLKVNLYYMGVAFTPCHNCPFKNENPAVTILKKTQKCFQRCPYEIVTWILSPAQFRLYQLLRPPEMKEKEKKRAKKEGKISQINQIKKLGELKVPSFYFLIISAGY